MKLPLRVASWASARMYLSEAAATRWARAIIMFRMRTRSNRRCLSRPSRRLVGKRSVRLGKQISPASRRPEAAAQSLIDPSGLTFMTRSAPFDAPPRGSESTAGQRPITRLFRSSAEPPKKPDSDGGEGHTSDRTDRNSLPQPPIGRPRSKAKNQTRHAKRDEEKEVRFWESGCSQVSEVASAV